MTLWPTRDDGDARAQRVTVRSDSEGNFVATLVAGSGGLGAIIHKHEHVRDVPLDTRALPLLYVRSSTGGELKPGVWP